MALDNLRRINEALDYFDRSLELEPNHPIALGNRGVVLQELGNDEEALKSYDKALSLSPQDSNTLYNKSRLRAKQGKDDESLGLLKQAIDLNETCKCRAKKASEFDKLRDEQGFKKLVTRLKGKYIIIILDSQRVLIISKEI